jgi:hypothetical protein
MRAQTYRLKSCTLAILDQKGQKIPLTIPTGSTVEVAEEEINGNRLVDVTWEGKKVKMFTTDLRERGEAVNGTAQRRITRHRARKPGAHCSDRGQSW